MSKPGSFIAAGTGDGDATQILSTTGALSMLVLSNTATTRRYVKFYDKASLPTASDTPVQRYEIPLAAANSAAVVVVPIPNEGLQFLNGIAFRIVTVQADSDSTEATAGDVIVNWALR